MKLTLGTVLFGAAVTTVITAVVAGLFILGSPTEERARRIDRRRVADLKGSAAATDLYWTRHSRLPSSLGELTAEPGVSISTGDPANSEIYDYQPVDSTRYEVCASFERESGETSPDPERNLWAHGSGRQCFRLEAEEITRNVVGRGWYSLDLSVGRRLHVKIRSPPLGGLAGIVLCGTNGETIGGAGDGIGTMRGNAGGGGSIYELEWTAAANGRYFLLVNADPGTAYRIEVR